MSKFKVGDKVIRVQGRGVLIPVGTVVTVRGVNDTGRGNFVTEYKGGYDAINFEYYVEQPLVDSTTVLTPLKVAEYLLAGTPELEYRGVSSGWFTVKHPHLLRIKTVQECTFRVKPQTVKVNGIDVPKPIDTAALGYPDKVYGINLSRHSIYRTTGHTNRGDFWATKEDAQAVLDAILKAFDV